MKKAKINNHLYDVLSAEDFMKQHSAISVGEVAVEVNGYVLPYLGQYGPNPGYYATPIAGYAVMPTEQQEEYSSEKIINFDDCENIKELMKMNQCLKSLEKDILTSSDNIYMPRISEDDTPEMAGLRQAIIDKQIDIDKYQDRFGSSFNNDKRIISNSPSITFPKLKSTLTNLDMKGTLIIEDVEGCPNPIGKKIIIPLNYHEEEGEI